MAPQGSRGQGVDEPVNSPAVMRGNPILPGHQWESPTQARTPL